MLSKNEIKYIQNLSQKKNRQQVMEFIVEGPKLTNELLLRKPDWLVKLYGTKDWWEKQTKQLQQQFSSFFFAIEIFELEKISNLQTPQEVVAIALLPSYSYVEEEDVWLLALDGIQDPGNLGTIIRTAHWFGIEQIICSLDCADAFSPKVVQATMGSIFEVKVIYQNLETLLSKQKLPVYGALLEGDNIYKKTNLQKGVILIGNEGKGISKILLPLVSSPITIPSIGDAESLNAAVATGILLAQFCGMNH